MKTVRLNGTGSAIADYLFTDVNFGSPAFAKFKSKTPGDGGLEPGKLVLLENFEAFCGVGTDDAIAAMVGNRSPDTFNLGGPSVVALINAAQLLSGSNTKVGFYSTNGNDSAGEKLRDILEKTPLDLGNYITAGEPAPVTYVLSDPTYNNGAGERTFVNGIRSAWRVEPDHLDEDFFTADIVLFGGTALVPNIHKHLATLTAKAKKQGCITVVTTVYDFPNQRKNPDEPWPLGESDETYKNTDLLITDREEALRLAGADTLDTAASTIIEKGVSALVVTNGAREVFCYADGRLFAKQRRLLPVSHAIEDARSQGPVPGDTTGAGDNFAGGVIASLIMQIQGGASPPFNIIDACAWGVASGDFACFYVGGTYLEDSPGKKRRKIEEIHDQYLRENGL